MRLRLGPWAVAGLVIALAGAAIRVNNAFVYKINRGFDFFGNWQYISRLVHSWALPAPDEGWSTGHPPLFYYLCAALARGLQLPDRDSLIITVRLLSSALGVLAIGFAAYLVWRTSPESSRRAVLAAALLLFLPVHIYMSPMLSEEILVASLSSIAVVVLALDLLRPSEAPGALRRAAAIGTLAGLALLTKLSGLIVVLAAALTYAVHDWRRGALRSGLGRAGVVLAVGLAIGGWWYVRSWVHYGYLYPHRLEQHGIMFTMPPGERFIQDYLYVPLATWTDPQLLSPDLLRSVWGSTYVTVWFDGHRIFLPKEGTGIAGMTILLLALLPTTAFGIGLVRGARRAIRSPGSIDTPLLLLTLLTLAGYAAFTWRNPWFAAVKGSFLLGGLSVPFAFYGSEVLAGWTRGPRLRSAVVFAALGALFLATAATFTLGLVFWKSWSEPVGLTWNPLQTP